MKKKITETISIKLRKSLLTSRAKTVLLSAILVIAFLTLNLWLDTKDLPKYDITENKLFSLSDESKKEMQNLDKDVNILVYGYDENSSVVDLLKQYSNSNGKIQYRILSQESDADKIKKYNLETGNQALIVETQDNFKILYSSDFSSYDYTTYQPIDLTENSITNAILNLTVAKKPKVYILTGHKEFAVEQYLTTLLSYLENEVFEYSTLNLVTAGSVPEDCDLIAVFSPQADLLEAEANILQNYINNGGNMIFTFDFVSEESSNIPNWQKILDLYGLTVENGLVYETDNNSVVSIGNSSTDSQASPLIFLPQVQNSEITSEIVSDGGALLLEMPRRIVTVDETKQEELKVSYQELLKSSDNSFFITDFGTDVISNIENQTPGSSIISLKATKTIDDTKNSQAIVIANGTFITNIESLVAKGYSQVNIYNNADFFINCVANLTNRQDTITIRKETSSATFTPTKNENTIVLIIAFSMPLIIIAIGIIVGNYRKHKR